MTTTKTTKKTIAKGAVDLRQALGEKKQALRALRFGSAGTKSTNVKAGKMLRREIARAMTSLADKSRQASLAIK